MAINNSLAKFHADNKNSKKQIQKTPKIGYKRKTDV